MRIELPQASIEFAGDINEEIAHLPWNLPLEEWPEDLVAALPRGISRHIVRFIRLPFDGIIAVKEIGEHRAEHEFATLTSLREAGAPCVEALAVVKNRRSDSGDALNPALVTAHLPYSLPYRAVFGRHQRPETLRRLIGALSVLMVRLHLLGFFWGDVSLSNTLFRRDAGEFAAYLVDAETGEIRESLTEGKRLYDIDVARTNIIGELMDLQAGGVLPEDYDVIAVGDEFATRYEALWVELTQTSSFGLEDNWRIAEVVERLNNLGFDVAGFSLVTDPQRSRILIQPKVVDAGHYSRVIMRLTGMDVEENQARRMMNDIEHYRLATDQKDVDMSILAHEWLEKVFEPTINGIPRELRAKLEPAEIFHQFLEHRWYISEKANHDVPFPIALESFIANVLRLHRDEETFLHRGEDLDVEKEGIAGDTGTEAGTPDTRHSKQNSSPNKLNPELGTYMI